MKDLFCANFTARRGGFAACQNCYCPECYSLPDVGEFAFEKFAEEDGFVVEEKERDRFLQARPCDDHYTIFQCERCHF